MEQVKSGIGRSNQGGTGQVKKLFVPQIFWTHKFLDPTSFKANYFGPKMFWTQIFFDSKYFLTKYFLGPNIFLDPKFLEPKFI